jgi:formate--tetrahydrofolate ligase
MEAAANADLNPIRPLYAPERALEDKITSVATEVYGARSVRFEPAAKRKLESFSALGFAKLPVCMAKTQLSLSDDPKRLGAPKEWTLTVSDAHLASGAGFIVVVAGKMMLMPGLPKVPQAARMHVTEDGSVSLAETEPSQENIRTAPCSRALSIEPSGSHSRRIP